MVVMFMTMIVVVNRMMMLMMLMLLMMMMISTISDVSTGETQAARLLVATFGGETLNFFRLPGIQPHNDHPGGSAAEPEIDLLFRQLTTDHTKKHATPTFQ